MRAEEFFRSYWGKTPVLLRDHWIRLPFRDDTLFFGIKAALKKKNLRVADSPTTRFYIEGGRIQADPSRLLPRSVDRTLDRYLDQLTADLKGKRFGLIIGNFHEFLPEKTYRAIRSFASKVSHHSKIRNGRVGVTHFLGDYDKTPSGVHREPEHIFCYVTRGVKTFRFWAPHRLDKDAIALDPLKYDRFKTKSFLITARAGEVIYLAPNFWHIAESNEGVNQSISLYFKLDSVERMILKDVSSIINAALDVQMRASNRDELPEFSKTISSLETALVQGLRSKKTRRELYSHYLNLSRNFGLNKKHKKAKR